MHVCIVGTGAAGWISCNILKSIPFIAEITIIGSPNIPSIGVGESTTLSIIRAHKNIEDHDRKEFIKTSDATVKYGVYYKDWSKNDFIHSFKAYEKPKQLKDLKIKSVYQYMRTFGNKSENVQYHDLINRKFFNLIRENKVFLSPEESHSWHFDASKYISYLKNLALKNQKIKLVKETVVDCIRNERGLIEELILSNGKRIKADYYINSSGTSEVNTKVFDEKYQDLSDVLLTNKAVFCPIEYETYEDKKNKLHPYTISKTMDYGWRWITPTWSRIGTGYVFSTNHVSISNAIDEFIDDLDEEGVSPRTVDFNPRYNKEPFKFNTCSIGLSGGFLEPLDAPGLAFTYDFSVKLPQLLSKYYDCTMFGENKNYLKEVESLNNEYIDSMKWWTSFILCQYKTCHRDDTDFWLDQKNVEYDYYNEILESIDNLDERYPNKEDDINMFTFTMAAKDINWKTKLEIEPFSLEDEEYLTVDHIKWIESFHSDHWKSIGENV